MKPRTVVSLWVLGLVCLVFYGCATSGNAPIEARTPPPSEKINIHIVEPGDTLYSIAWRYEKDFRNLAAINGIKSPYTIYRGQRIRIEGNSGTVSSSDTRSSSAATASVRTTPTRTTSVSTASSSRPASTSATQSQPPSPPLPSSVEDWNWPLQGKIVKTFGSTSLTKGITIDTSDQKDVKAAADGVVVYAGSGVRGYGNFLILKHSDLYLSAYAYNEALISKEGDQVRQGQMIAKAGKDQEGLPRLYFEIRKDGKPVDPIRYLPKR